MDTLSQAAKAAKLHARCRGLCNSSMIPASMLPCLSQFKHGDAASAGGVEAISSSGSGSSSGHDLVPHDWWAQQEHRLSLPEVTLTGPLELVLPEPQPVSVFLPHAADVGLVRRVLLASGATVRLAHLRAITLRRPVELPNLPGQYLAEVYAQAQLGEPEKGFHYAPGEPSIHVLYRGTLSVWRKAH